MRLRAFWFGVVWMVAACGGADNPREASARIPHVEPPPASGLVWTVDAEGRNRTLWVSLDGTPLASQPIEGPLWAEGSCLWQWVKEPVEVPVWDEAPDEEIPDASTAVGTRTVWQGVLRELVADTRVVAFPAPDPGTVRDIDHELRVEASVGPYLFVTERVSVSSWGAHGSTEVRAAVWDLRAAGLADPLTDRERSSIRGSERVLARRALMAEGIDTNLEGQWSADEVELVALRPRWDVSNGLQVELQFATESCYACGDGEWSDYTRSVRVPAQRIPEQLARHAHLPDWVRSAARELPDASIAGFSRVEEPAPARVLESLRR